MIGSTAWQLQAVGDGNSRDRGAKVSTADNGCLYRDDASWMGDGNQDCCSGKNCGLGEGRCSSDSQCSGSLKCVTDACTWSFDTLPDSGDGHLLGTSGVSPLGGSDTHLTAQGLGTLAQSVFSTGNSMPPSNAISKHRVKLGRTRPVFARLCPPSCHNC